MNAPPYLACPYSLEPDEVGEVHPHQAGEWVEDGVRRCAVCRRAIPGALRSDPMAAARNAQYRAEFRALIAPILAAQPVDE